MINLSTPYPDMHREFWHEYDRQEYWVRKWNKRNGNTMRQMIENALCTPSKLIDRVEYNKKHGNRWINYIYAQPIVNGRTAMEYHSVCYWEGYGSFGTFSAYRLKGENLMFISTTHYWQRYCERTHAVMHGVHTAMDFFAQYPSSKVEILPPTEGDIRRHICIHYTCGAAYGVEVSKDYHIFELRTFIDNASMTGDKARHHKQMLSDLDSDTVNKGIAQIKSILKANKGMTIGDAFKHVTSEYKDETFQNIAGREKQYIQSRMKELRQTLTHEQAVEVCMKDDMFKGYTLPDELMRLHIASNDQQHMQQLTDEGFNTFMASVEKEAGAPLPTTNQGLFRSVYTDGFTVGADVMKGYIIISLGLDPRYETNHLLSLQEYKHQQYLEMREFYQKEYADESQETLSAIIYTNARGFDDGMKRMADLVKKHLGINVAYQ